MKPVASFLLAFLVSLAPLPAAPAFQTGQPAASVLGQPDFTTNTAENLPNRFSFPVSSAIDPTTGKLFVADSSHNRILRFSSVAALLDGSNPEAVFGQVNFTASAVNRGGSAAANTFSFPAGITVDAAGRLWVADFNNRRVLRFDLASFLGNGPTADRVLGQPDFTTTTTGSTASKMDSPFAVRIDSSGNLWVADRFNNRVLRFDDAVNKIDGANSDGVLGQPGFGTNASALTATGMVDPADIALDPNGNLWVADPIARRVTRFDAAAQKTNGAAADAVIGQADFISALSGVSATAVTTPLGVHVDSSGALWVVDNGSFRVTRYLDAASLGNLPPADLVLGQPDFDTSGGNVTRFGLNAPTAVTGSPSGDLFVTDQGANRVLRFSPVAEPIPAPPPAAAPTVSALGKKKLQTTKAKLTLKGTATDATLVEFKAGKGGFKKAKGSPANWKAPVKLEPGKTIVKVRASGPGGTSKILKFTVTRK